MAEDNMESKEKSVSNVIRIDESQACGHLDRVVRSTVEQTINDLLDAEADRLIGAEQIRTERSSPGSPLRPFRAQTAYRMFGDAKYRRVSANE